MNEGATGQRKWEIKSIFFINIRSHHAIICMLNNYPNVVSLLSCSILFVEFFFCNYFWPTKIKAFALSNAPISYPILVLEIGFFFFFCHQCCNQLNEPSSDAVHVINVCVSNAFAWLKLMFEEMVNRQHKWNIIDEE